MARLGIALFLALVSDPTRPELVVRAAPPMSIARLGIGCSPVLLTAEIRGPEDEGWYCPRVEWAWPNGTTSATESDCPPYDRRDECVESQEGCGLRGWVRDGDRVIENRKDCPCTIVGYPRRWTRHVCIPQTPTDDPWEIVVRLSRDGKVFARNSVRVFVR